MEIDKRVIELLKANAMTFGWDVSDMICEAMRKYFSGGALGQGEDLVKTECRALACCIESDREEEE